MRKLLVLFGLLFLYSNATEAQHKNQFVKSGEIINAAYQFCDSSWYTKAIDTLKTIGKGDTAYVLALTELSYCHMQAKKYAEAIAYANKALTYTSPYKQRLAIIKGNTYDGWGYPDSAILLYKQNLKKYPYSYLLYYNMGITYMNQKKYDDAIKAFQQTIIYNPFHTSSYIALGRIMARMGQYVHAMLCIETYLVIEPHATRSNYNLVFLNNMVSNALSSEHTPISPTTDNKAFEEIDQLLKSGIALNSGYKVKVNFDAPVAKQTQLLFESIQYKPNTGDFWMDYLAPMFLKVKNAVYMEDFMYTIATSAPNKDIASQLKKRQKNIKEMNELLGNHLLTFLEKQKITINGVDQLIDLHLDSKNIVISCGNYAADHKTKTGYWKFFHSNGEVKEEGYYVDGKLEGKWLNYNENGILTYIDTYSKGLMNGDYIGYYDSGNMKFKSSYTNNLAHGDVTYYYDCDAISAIKHFENGKLNGKETLFFKNGAISSVSYYANDSLEGESKTFFANGAIKSKYIYSNNKIQGKGIDYYRNGKPSYIGEYTNTIRDGQYSTFYQNSNSHIVGTYKKGKQVGEWKEFNDKGVLTDLYMYNEKGNLDKDYKTWDKDGKLHCIFTYDNDILKEIKYVGKDGKVSGNARLNNKTTPVKGYFADGTLLYEGAYTSSKPDGTWIYYYKCGKKHIVQNYKDGLLNGRYTEFLPSGQLAYEFNYTNSEYDGYYTQYYPNGKLYQEGWYVNGDQEGKWYFWNPDGTLEKTADFLSGKLNGFLDEYAPDSKLQYSTGYKNGNDISFIDFDTLGNPISHTILDGKNDFYIHYPNGKIRAKGEYKCTQFNSKYTLLDRNGAPEAEYGYVNGEKDGPYINLYPNGKTATEGFYGENHQTGMWKYYDEEGHIIKKGKFLNNQKDSLWIGYHSNGKIKFNIWYNDDEMIDTAKFFDSFGEFMYSLVYDEFGLVSYQYRGLDGFVSKNISPKDSGIITTYYKNGKVSSKQAYIYGNIQGKQLLYFSNGNPYKEFFLAGPNFYDGKLIEYYENGKIKKVENFLMNQSHGLDQYFRPDGTLDYTEEFRDDNKHGSFIFYGLQGKQIKQNKYWGNLLLN